MSILQELWYGNVNPIENKTHTEEERILVELMSQLQDDLEDKLKGNELNTLKKFVNSSAKHAMLIETQAFEIGFKLAIKILTE